MASEQHTKLPLKVVVIDSEDAMANFTAKLLKSIGIEQVVPFTDAEAGYSAISTGAFDAAVVDWKLRGKTSGLALLSRLRRNEIFVNFPLIITSGNLRQNELNFLGDFQCTGFLEKPLASEKIERELAKLNIERRWYLENSEKISKALSVSKQDEKSAVLAITGIINTAPNPFPVAMIAAQEFVVRRLFADANDIYTKVLVKDSAYLPALTGRAKLFSIQGRFSDAMEALKQAQKISPKNLDRLALMGEIEVSLKNPEAAIDYFNSALAVDNRDIKSNIGLVVAKNLAKFVSMQISMADDEMSVAKTINNLGVELARKGIYEKAIKYYLMSFSFVGSPDLKSRISFNMGLSFKRWNKLPQAKYWLEKSLELTSNNFAKPEKYLLELKTVVAAPGFGPYTKKPALPSTKSSSSGPSELVPFAPIINMPVGMIEDQSFLEEEVVGGPPQKAIKSSPVSGSGSGIGSTAFDSMVADIDKIAEFSDDFNFADPI